MDEPALVLLESVEVEDEEDDSLNEKIYKKFVELRVASHLDRKAEANQNLRCSQQDGREAKTGNSTESHKAGDLYSLLRQWLCLLRDNNDFKL